MIPSVGQDKELDDLIFNAELEVLNGPIKTETGYHFFRKVAHLPESIKPFEEVKDTIKEKLRMQIINETKEKIYQNRLSVYNIVIDTLTILSVNIDNKSEIEPIKTKTVVNSNNPKYSFTMEAIHNYFLLSEKEKQDRMRDKKFTVSYVNQMIFEAILLDEAIAAGFDKQLREKDEYKQKKEAIVLNRCFDVLIRNVVKFSEEEALENYNKNKDSYLTKASRNAQIFAFESEEVAKEAYKEASSILSAKKLFGLKSKFSPEEINEKMMNIVTTKTSKPEIGVILENIEEKGIVKGIGKDDTILSNIWSTEVNQLSKIFKTEKNGFVFVRVVKFNEPSIKPFESVKAKIIETGTRDKMQATYEAYLKEFEAKYKVKKYFERLEEILTAEDLFSMAQTSRDRKDFAKAIEHYEKIYATFKNGKDDANALFMQGYLLSEEMNKDEEALKIYEKFVEEFKDSDLFESAKAMIDDLKGVKSLDTFMNGN